MSKEIQTRRGSDEDSRMTKEESRQKIILCYCSKHYALNILRIFSYYAHSVQAFSFEFQTRKQTADFSADSYFQEYVKLKGQKPRQKIVLRSKYYIYFCSVLQLEKCKCQSRGILKFAIFWNLLQSFRRHYEADFNTISESGTTFHLQRQKTAEDEPVSLRN